MEKNLLSQLKVVKKPILNVPDDMQFYFQRFLCNRPGNRKNEPRQTQIDHMKMYKYTQNAMVKAVVLSPPF